MMLKKYVNGALLKVVYGGMHKDAKGRFWHAYHPAGNTAWVRLEAKGRRARMVYAPGNSLRTRHFSMQDIKGANHSAGQFFFEPSSMRFFASRVGDKVYQGSGGVFFVTSEQFTCSEGTKPRRYTVREFHPETADVSTVGEFNEMTRSQAHTTAAAAAAA